MCPVSVELVAYPARSARAIAPYVIEPAHPPFPTAWYFPFHPDAGSHTSTLISESGVGLIVAATRQKAGSVAYACPPSPEVGEVGGENAPATTGCAMVMVVSDSFNADRPSHEPAAVNASVETVTATLTANRALITGFMASPQRA